MSLFWYTLLPLGLMLGFLTYSNYFIFKVSKGLSLYKLYGLVLRDPIKDALLYYTFYNLLMARAALLVSWLLLFCWLGVTLWHK